MHLEYTFTTCTWITPGLLGLHAPGLQAAKEAAVARGLESDLSDQSASYGALRTAPDARYQPAT